MLHVKQSEGRVTYMEAMHKPTWPDPLNTWEWDVLENDACLGDQTITKTENICVLYIAIVYICCICTHKQNSPREYGIKTDKTSLM